MSDNTSNATDPLAGATLYIMEDFFGGRWVEFIARDVESLTRADVIERIAALAESYERAPKATGKGSRAANASRLEWAKTLRALTGPGVPMEVASTKLSVGRRIGGREL